MDAAAPEEEALSAGEWVLRETLMEMQVALEASRPCTYGLAPAGLRALGVTGLAQPVFACKTCAAAKGGAPVGVCEPCALRCHADHDVTELQDKRQFQCDCPTERSAAPCVAQPKGAAPSTDDGAASSSASPPPPSLLPANPANRYGHNFVGRFCTCDREYDAARDTLYQCLRCDEWLHSWHVPGCLPSAVPFAGMACPACVGSAPYLARLARYAPRVCANAVAAAGAPAAAASAAAAKTPSPGPPVASTTAAAAVAASPTGAPASVVALPQHAVVAAAPASSPSPPPPPAPPSPPTMLQPWVVCLTCTAGADDGRGVCMACAAACHGGHVLGKPRITEFYCDCSDLLKEGSGSGGKPAPCALAAAVPAPAVVAELHRCWCAADAVAPAAAAAAAEAPSAAAAAPSQPPAAVALAAVAGAAVFTSDDDDLLARLCRCAACLARYAADGCATWFFESPLDGPGGAGGSELVDADTAAAVPQLLERLTTAGAGAGAGRRSSTGGSAAAAAAAGGGGGEDVDAMATKVGAALTALSAAGFKSTYELGASALAALPATQQLDAMSAYATLRSGFLGWLKGFAESGRVVTKADVEGYFAGLRRDDGDGDGADGGRRVRPRTE
jgi:hypothetical protein